MKKQTIKSLIALLIFNSTILISEKQVISPIENPNSFAEKLSNAAIQIIDKNVIYTPDYVKLKYPNGDVPSKTGVCTDVIIRAYRKLNIDLQKEVHEDMVANFTKYPNLKVILTASEHGAYYAEKDKEIKALKERLNAIEKRLNQILYKRDK
mgnify:CR=1 FL=1